MCRYEKLLSDTRRVIDQSYENEPNPLNTIAEYIREILVCAYVVAKIVADLDEEEKL